MDTTNLDIYGHDELPWSRARDAMPANNGPDVTYFLGTVTPDGTPHAAGVGAVWLRDTLWFVTGPTTRKGRNLAANPACTVSCHLPGIDVVLEGRAERVTDAETLEWLAGEYRQGGWPAQVEGDAFTAPFSAPSAGPPPVARLLLHAREGVRRGDGGAARSDALAVRSLASPAAAPTSARTSRCSWSAREALSLKQCFALAREAGLEQVDTWGRHRSGGAPGLGPPSRHAARSFIRWPLDHATRTIDRLLAGEQPSTADALVHGVPLRSDGLLASWQERLRGYPSELAARRIEEAALPWGGFAAAGLLTIVRPGDRLALHEWLVDGATRVLTITHALNRVWQPTSKRLAARLAPLEVKPDRLAERIEQALVEPDPRQALLGMTELQLDAVRLAPSGPNVDRARRWLAEGAELLRSSAALSPSGAGSRRTRPCRARGSAARPGSAGWRAPRRRRPAGRTPGRSPRRGSSGRRPPSPGP